jgi:hypothetical protein
MRIVVAERTARMYNEMPVLSYCRAWPLRTLADAGYPARQIAYRTADPSRGEWSR